jgi:hypothetical protein
MKPDYKKGDRVICVTCHVTPLLLKVGQIYTIEEISFDKFYNCKVIKVYGFDQRYDYCFFKQLPLELNNLSSEEIYKVFEMTSV